MPQLFAVTDAFSPHSDARVSRSTLPDSVPRDPPGRYQQHVQYAFNLIAEKFSGAFTSSREHCRDLRKPGFWRKPRPSARWQR